MWIRLLLLVNIVVISTTVHAYSGDGYRIRRDANETNNDLELTVGKETMIPEVEDESEEEQEKEANDQPTTDVKINNDERRVDKQKHDGRGKNKGRNIENGMPARYPLKAESAESSAHDNEIGGCRDHPRAGLVCQKCDNGNKCFPAEHESYTYSYCRRSCRHCDPSTSSFHTFWRLRAMSEFEPTWMLQQVEFYADPQERISLVDDPEKAYASSVYTGYKPSFAFDNNNSTAWYPSGWGIHDNNDDWIAYEFTVAVRVHGIRMVVDKDHATAAPKKVVVEASDKMYGPFQKKWTVYNNDYSIDKIYKLLECDVLWRRMEVDDGAWCFRLIAKLETWEGARRTCEIEGGDIATITNKDEQRFVTDEVGLCSHTWFGLSHTNQGYYWNDGSNSTFRNWKEELTYSDVQKQTLNCAAMDPEGVWYNFHCSNKFYFLCKKRLVPRPDPRPDLTDNAWPYPPEVPPLIFFSPNVTVPVINSKNLEPGIFPDANGKVEGEEEEDITLSDLFYEQTVEHLKEKGLKPSEEIEQDVNVEETDFTQELNKIAINTSPGDFQNETSGDQAKNGSSQAHHQEHTFEEIPGKEANNAESNSASADAPKPKPKHKEKPVPPPPEDSDKDEDSSYPLIVHGKPVDSKNGSGGKGGDKLPKGQSLKNDNINNATSAPFFPEYTTGSPVPAQFNADVHEQPYKAGTIDSIPSDKKKKKKKQPSHANGDTGPMPDKDDQSSSLKQNPQQNSTYQPGMMFYVPNVNGTYTLMRPIYPWGSYNGYSSETGSNMANMAYPDNSGGQAQQAAAQQAAAQPPGAPPKPPPPKEGNGTDDDDDDSVEEPPDIKKTDHKGQKNKEIPGPGPLPGPVGPSIAQQNISKTISKTSRKKIKVLQPLESAAHGEDIATISDTNKVEKVSRKKVLSRAFVHPKHKRHSMKKHHVRRKHKSSKVVAETHPIVDNQYCCKSTESVAPKVHANTKMNRRTTTAKLINSTSSPSLGVDKESADIKASGSGSGSEIETDTAEIISDTDEEFWSRRR